MSHVGKRPRERRGRSGRRRRAWLRLEGGCRQKGGGPLCLPLAWRTCPLGAWRKWLWERFGAERIQLEEKMRDEGWPHGTTDRCR